MSNLTQTELEKIRKASLQSFTLSSDMKISVIDSKLRDLNSEIKRMLTKKNTSLEFAVIKISI